MVKAAAAVEANLGADRVPVLEGSAVHERRVRGQLLLATRAHVEREVDPRRRLRATRRGSAAVAAAIARGGAGRGGG